jgi:hypothetical protein
MVNPYAFTGPVRDPAVFFGRTALRREILDGVRRGDSFGITGTVRIGKSSLLFQLRHTLLEELKAPTGSALVPVLVRNRDFPGPSLSVVCQRIVEELQAALSASEDWRRGLRLFSGNLEDGETLRAFTDALVTIMRARSKDSRIVLMIDDVDRMSQHDWSRILFDELRHLVQNARAGVRISLVVTGDFVPWSSHEAVRSPFPDIAINMKTLGLLSGDETEELVMRPTGIDREFPVVSSIVRETGGHPFLAKYLMNKLVDAVDGDLTRATPEALQALVDRYSSERADFRQWALRFTDSDRRAYDLIASGSGATRDGLLRALGNPQQTSRAIQVLIQTGVVREERPGSDRYVVGGDMFRRWFYDTRQLSTSTNHEPAVVRSPQPPRRPSEEIQFTVYRPNVLRPGEWKTMLAFVHLAHRRPDAPRSEPSPAEQVQTLARQALGKQAAQYDHDRAEARSSVPRESDITLVPVVPGLEFRPERRTFLWVDDVHQEQFTVRARPEADGTVVHGRLSAFLGVILLAEVEISIRVDSAYPADRVDAPTQASSANLYRRVFASYSRKDAEVVRQFELFVQSLGDVYLRDVHDIKPGMDWQTRLRELIQEADVFQLFWSNNAMRSSHVRAEWEYALSLNRQGFVRPTYWEDPFPESTADGLPPEDLRRLHFHRLGWNPSPDPAGETSLIEDALANGHAHEVVVTLSKDVLRPGESSPGRDVLAPVPVPPRPGAILQPSQMPKPEASPRSPWSFLRVVLAVLVLIGVILAFLLIA